MAAKTLEEAAQKALAALEWYVKNDDTNEWDEYNIKAGFTAGKRRGERAIKDLKRAIKEAKKNEPT